MKVLMVFCSLLALSFAQDNGVCYDAFLEYCNQKDSTYVLNCNASYGGASFLMKDLSNYANAHVTISFDYLLLATNFGSYEKDRKGFEKLFRHLSDSTWEDGIDLIKYITKRGGVMDFDESFNDTTYVHPVVQLNEIQGLARALDTHKNLAAMTFELHRRAIKEAMHEPELASYLEEKFLHKHADIIRNLAGHIHDVKQLISYSNQRSVSLFIFDEYLKSH